MRQVEGFVAAGGKELVLSGINLGRWGRDFSAGSKQESLAESGARHSGADRIAAPAAQLDRAHGLGRRTDRSDARIWRRTRSPGMRICRCNRAPTAVLRRMHRRYRPWHYAEKVRGAARRGRARSHARRRRDGWFSRRDRRRIRGDAGFFRALPFGYLHLFPFSPRPGTAIACSSQISARAIGRTHGHTASTCRRKKRNPPQAFCRPNPGSDHAAYPCGSGSRKAARQH